MPKKLANVVIVLVLIFGAISLFSGRLFPQSVDVGIAGTNGVSLPEGGRSESHAPGSQDSLALTDSNGVSSTDNPPYITKVTMLYGERNEVYERALQSHVRHGDIHGYPVRVLRQRMLGRLWTKPAWLLSIVLEEMAKPPGKRIEWIFWFDADTVIANPDIPLEIFVPPEPEYGHIHFLCGNDHNGLNDGAFLLRIGDYALHMLAAALSVESFRPEVDLKYSEQSAIEHVVTAGDVYRPWDGARYIDGYAKIPQRWMNAYMGARDEHGMPDKKKRPHSNSIHEGGKFPRWSFSLQYFVTTPN